jgi:hypothetical protein
LNGQIAVLDLAARGKFLFGRKNLLFRRVRPFDKSAVSVKKSAVPPAAAMFAQAAEFAVISAANRRSERPRFAKIRCFRPCYQRIQPVSHFPTHAAAEGRCGSRGARLTS